MVPIGRSVMYPQVRDLHYSKGLWGARGEGGKRAEFVLVRADSPLAFP